MSQWSGPPGTGKSSPKTRRLLVAASSEYGTIVKQGRTHGKRYGASENSRSPLRNQFKRAELDETTPRSLQTRQRRQKLSESNRFGLGSCIDNPSLAFRAASIIRGFREPVSPNAQSQMSSYGSKSAPPFALQLPRIASFWFVVRLGSASNGRRTYAVSTGQAVAVSRSMNGTAGTIRFPLLSIAWFSSSLVIRPRRRC